MTEIQMSFKNSANIKNELKKEVKRKKLPVPCKIIANIGGVQVSVFHVEMNYSASGLGVYETDRKVMGQAR